MNKADDLRLWRTFIMLADRGNLSEVADEVGVEISTVSRAVSQLEKSIGHQLFKRNARPAVLTDRGRTLVPKVRQILELQDALLDELRADSSDLRGEIRLSVSYGYAGTKLPFFLAKFNELYPSVSFRVTPGLTVEDLKKGLCDIAVKTGEVADESVIRFYRGHNFYLPLASPAYLETHPMPREPRDLAKHTVYLYSGPVRPPTEFFRKGNRIEPLEARNTIRMPSIQAVKNAVLAGLGVAADLTLNKCAAEVLAGKLVPIIPGWYRPPMPVYTVISRSAWMLRRVRIFSEWFNQSNLEADRRDVEKMRAFLRSRWGTKLPEIAEPRSAEAMPR